MKKILIIGDSREAEIQIENNIEEYGKLEHATVYFNNYNFILSKYEIMSQKVHMILECSEMQIQIESANCGYQGGGPTATISILTTFGLKKNEIERLVWTSRALDFSVIDGQIYHICTDEIFSGLNYSNPKWIENNKFEGSKNISVDLMKRKIRFFNPQRHDMVVFFRLLNGMSNKEMEYYIGEECPLEEGLYIGREVKENLFRLNDAADLKGVEHVNLVISGDECKIVCLIDRDEEVETINMIYRTLAGKDLFENFYLPLTASLKDVWKAVVRVWRNKNYELHDVVSIPEKYWENNRVN